MVTRRARSLLSHVLLAGAVAAVVTTTGVPTGGSARARSTALPLGDPDLSETRTVQTLAPGVTLTRIQRGSTPADPDEVATTSRGPWRIAVLTIDRSLATGHLRTTYGPDLSRAEPVTALVQLSRALVGVNASFFAEGTAFPGDPVGLAVVGGRLVSNPAPASVSPNEHDVLIDPRHNRLAFGRYSWAGRLTNRRTGRVQRLEFVNHAPVVPAGCRRLVHQTRCPRDGDVSLVTRTFGARTPAGPGVEVVLGRTGCVVRTASVRGTALARGQSSVQATGLDTRSLLRARRGGCLTRSVRLLGPDGHRVSLDRWVFGASGRYRLAVDGRELVPAGSGPFFTRNPRTVVGSTGTGLLMVVVVDGRQTTSVGTTMQETADVVRSLGLRDAVNLDGGGSSTLSVRGELANQPSGAGERPVGDALVYVDTPFR